MIGDAIHRLRTRCGMPVDSSQRGPVLLNRFFEEQNLEHVALEQLSVGNVMRYLWQQGINVAEPAEPGERLAGLMFYAGRVGWAFVNADDILARRRFTAAHELGHAVLHPNRMELFTIDTEQTLREADGTGDAMEREANRFAAELLMPEEVCRERADELRREYRTCPRVVLAYRLASELLVSAEAMRYRLKSLEIGDDH